MRVLIVGAGGVGAAVAAIARRRAFIEHLTLAGVDAARAPAVAARMGDDARFGAAEVDASDEAQLAELIASTGPDAVLNATDPRFNEPRSGGLRRRAVPRPAGRLRRASRGG